MANDNVLISSSGASLSACSDSNRDYPDYLLWNVAPDRRLGVVQNSPETRLFLENVLRRFRRDATRLKAAEFRRTLRKTGEQDFLAGKPINAFYEIQPPQKRGRRGRLTESMRAEYEIGYRAARKEYQKKG